MKRIIIVMILIIGSLVLNGQTRRLHKPVQPYNENGYTISQFEAFASGSSYLSQSYREKLLERVNNFLFQTGLSSYANNGNLVDVHWIFSTEITWVEYRKYKGMRNSCQSYDERSVEWYWDQKPFEGLVLVLHFNGYELDLGKIICMNLLGTPWIIGPNFTQNPAPKPNSHKTGSNEDIITTYSNATPNLGCLNPTTPAVTCNIKKDNTLLWIAGTAAVIIVTCVVLRNQDKSVVVNNYSQIPINTPGGPGGAPTTPATDVGGPGGGSYTGMRMPKTFGITFHLH